MPDPHRPLWERAIPIVDAATFVLLMTRILWRNNVTDSDAYLAASGFVLILTIGLHVAAWTRRRHLRRSGRPS